MKLSDKLEILRERSGLSAREVARRLRTPTTTFGRWLSGETEPRLSESAAIADLFGVPLDFLADDALDEPPPVPELAIDEQAALEFYRDLRAALGPTTALKEVARLAACGPAPESPAKPTRTMEPLEGSADTTTQIVPKLGGGKPKGKGSGRKAHGKDEGADPAGAPARRR